MAVLFSNVDTSAITKTLWPQRRVENTVYADHPFLALVPKDEEFYGQNLVLAVRFADSQGRSAQFSIAQGQVGNFRARKFILTRAKDYQVCQIDTESILATKNDRGALIKALDTEIDSGMNNISKSLAVSLFRGQTGVLSTVGAINLATSSGDQIILGNINDVTSFEVGMVLVAAQTLTGASRSTPATATVQSVDRTIGAIYFSTGTLSGANWAVNDNLFANGDNANGTGSGNKTSGLADWLPGVTPITGDSFFSVDRSVDPTRLAGQRIDISGLNPEEGCVTVFSKQAREGGRPNYMVLNHQDFRNVEISLGSKVCYETLSVGEIGFQALKVNGPKGPVMLVADQDCPAGIGYGLDMRTWKLYSLEKCPQILDLDGNRMLRVYNADMWETRIMYFAQLGCDAPGWNARAVMPS